MILCLFASKHFPAPSTPAFNLRQCTHWKVYSHSDPIFMSHLFEKGRSWQTTGGRASFAVPTCVASSHASHIQVLLCYTELRQQWLNTWAIDLHLLLYYVLWCRYIFSHCESLQQTLMTSGVKWGKNIHVFCSRCWSLWLTLKKISLDLSVLKSH